MDDGKKGKNDEEEKIVIEDDVLELLRQTLIEDKKRSREKRDIPKEQLDESLHAQISEFLSCFIVFGYDFDGNLVEMKKASNKMEKSAMDNLFIQKFGEFMGERGIPRDDKYDF